MSIELGTALTIFTIIAGGIVFYFTQMRGFDTRLENLKSELQEQISTVKDEHAKEITAVKVVQAEHGMRLHTMEGYIRSVDSRLNSHVNGKHGD